MSIVDNKPCPKCRKQGHDKTGDHLIIFENGAGYCNRSQYHKNGKPYYTLNGAKPVKVNGKEITGDIRYTAEQFKEIEKSGVFEKDPYLREVALGGMKEKERYKVLNKKEKKKLNKQWSLDVKHFNSLSVRNLVSRGIRGEIAKLYNVRVGLNADKKVARHYYPAYDLSLDLTGAFCRNLPKDFRSGTLGKTWGNLSLFGMQANSEISKSGTRKRIATITGGACDAMATQQMLLDSKEGTKYEGHLEYVYSVNRGEAGVQEVVDNLPKLKKFKKVILAFDDDEEGRSMTAKCAKLLRDRAFVLQMPEGCKDPNQCLEEEKEEEFVDAWWNASEFSGSDIKTVAELFDQATQEITYGTNWPWATVTDMTFGIRDHNLYTIGGGSGVGKTEVAKEIIEHLTEVENELVGVIFMEEPAWFTVRVLAGKYINKKIHLPKNKVKKGQEGWDKSRDYTEEEATAAVARLREKDMIRIADCKGDTSIDNIMDKCDELRAQGCKRIMIDNLTTINHNGKEGTVKAIDESMRRLGTYIQEEPVAIFLLSHLSKPDESRTPFEHGGAVRQGDFRGSQSIAFWSTFMIGVERNTEGEGDEKFVTRLRCVKDRLTGQHTGEVATLFGNPKTGRLLEPSGHQKIVNKTKSTKPNKTKSAKKKLTSKDKQKEY